ncbi:putative M18-family aminopeptidase 2 [Anaerovibrio sp. JC8]|uniref:M18 family aminopeptidase n=1 Tax=Anaerovibrio sp. JC8 TaxID=1240085 RepID=UPI000A0A86E0|nr:M18 family aminopeptidase [Anaerovibrio sp. JC8]ORT98879.1 putative M18-family aminopeptidase 2 [Anaerovibrio sp. JC8]
MYGDIIDLLEFIKKSPSPWHTVQTAADMLLEAGFQELDWTDGWQLQQEGRYFTKIYGSSIFAFTVGKGQLTEKNSLRLAAAHTDFPGFRIKPEAGIIKDGYGLLNTEGYGGAILYSWLDRPLSIAGKVVARGKDALTPETMLLDFARPLVTIPSLAIHMDKKINEGKAFNKQKDMLPLAAVFGKEDTKSFLLDLLSAEAGVAKEDILSYELNIYPYEPGCQLGIAGELVSSPRLDNITSVVACLQGIIESGTDGLNIIALFDNEEIGSRTKQGAASANLMQLIERIYTSMGYTREQMWQGINGGFMLSVDVAHGLHPNYPDKTDPTNRPMLNKGFVIKQAASQSYACDAEAVAMVKGLCQERDIPCQQYVNRSDMPGGATLGSIASALVPVRTVDIGVPILAMHSARETMGAADQTALCNVIRGLFQY